MFRAGDKHFISAGDNMLKTLISTSATHTHTASYQRFPHKTYAEMIAIHSYLPLKTGVIMLRRSKRYLNAHWCLTLH